MTYVEAYDLLNDLLKQRSWLPDCVNRFDITDFSDQSDAAAYLRERKNTDLDLSGSV